VGYPRAAELLEEILPTNSLIHDFEVKYDFPTIGPKIMSLNARSIYNRMRKQVRLILLAITDITERSRIEHQRHELSRELEKKVSELEQANRALLQDMEERKRLEDQLRQAQKMESMGTLAAGIAHDLNNILNIIQGYTFVLGRGAESDEIGESVEVITETTKRGAALVQQLLTLARKTETKLESINANTVIQELSNLLKETFPKRVCSSKE
jgi:C4-dicarboxylate-specific signal transduction histidine kinase